MSELKLLAVDEEDLSVISAYCQDAVVRAGALSFDVGAGRFLVPMNRFVWEDAGGRRGFFRRAKPYQRRQAVLHFQRVTKVRQSGVLAGDPDQVLALLALRFEVGDAPSGTVELVFAGGSAIRLDVECIEAQLADLGAAWATENRPDHERDGPGA